MEWIYTQTKIIDKAVFTQPNIPVYCLFDAVVRMHACAALDLGQANQTRYKGLRGEDAGIKIHPSEVWSNSLVLSVSNSSNASLQKVPHSVLPFVGRIYVCMLNFLHKPCALAVLGQGSGVIDMAKENSHPTLTSTFLLPMESSDLILCS